MSKAATKTDNSYLQAKIKLRIDGLPTGDSLEILDCFAGSGLIWNTIARRVEDKKFSILPIDQKSTPGTLGLVGDNTKFLSSMDLSRFDVIDLDAYGSPFRQLRIVLSKRCKPGVVIFGTFIQSVMGRLPNDFLSDLGYTRSMVRKIPTLFCRHGRDKLLAWLGQKGIKSLRMCSAEADRKNYFSFCLL